MMTLSSFLLAARLFLATHAAIASEMWREIGHGLPISAIGAQTLVDPLCPSTLYTISYTGLLFKSTDGSRSWFSAAPLP
jgi:hypothetical protein